MRCLDLEYWRDQPTEEIEESRTAFYDTLKWRIDRDRSNIIIIVGEQGAGKSNTALWLSYYLNKRFYKKDFDIKRQLFHSIIDFTKSLKTLRGCFVMLEEVGISLNSKSWREAQNRVFRDIIEAFRIYGVSLVMTLPNLNDLDKSSRYLSHFIIRMNYPGNAIIFRKFSSFLTDKQSFLPVWKWSDIPDMKKVNKSLWDKYDEFHKDFMVEKRVDWIESMELQQLKKKYKKTWYKQRTTGFSSEVL